jgi:hypothetical protein
MKLKNFHVEGNKSARRFIRDHLSFKKKKLNPITQFIWRCRLSVRWAMGAEIRGTLNG